MSKNRILAIEDDEGVCRLLRHSLAREDYDVRIACSGEEGLAMATDEPPDLFLLDLELPGMDGLTVCQNLKQDEVTRALPVIILTGKGDENDVVAGLEMGADDYIVKPFSPKILNARVQAVLRRRGSPQSQPVDNKRLTIGDLCIDTARNSISLGGVEFELSPTKYRFVLLFCFLLSGEEPGELAQLGDGEEIADLVTNEGMALYAENRLGRLLPVFEALARAGYKEHPVVARYYGLALLETNHVEAHACLTLAEKGYRDARDPLGELVVLAHLVFYHIVFDGDEKQTIRYLERAETLNQAYFDRLSVFARIAVAQNLAIGRSFLHNDFEGAGQYLDIAEALADGRGLVNLVVLNRLAAIFKAYVCGSREEMLETLEESLRFLNHPQVSLLHKALLKLLQVKYFSLSGEFDYFRLQQQWLQEEFGRQLDQWVMPNAHLLITQLDLLMFEQRYEEALVLSSETLLRKAVIANDFLYPLFNGYRAFCAALCGQQESLQEALECDPPMGHGAEITSFRQGLARLYCCRALALSGREPEALLELDVILPQLERGGWQNLVLQAGTQRLLTSASQGGGASELVDLLARLEEQDVWYLATLSPADYHHLYLLATAAGLDTTYLQLMLRRRLGLFFDDKGESLPMLQMISLGSLKIRIGRDVAGLTDGFSRTQRECLALLAAVPEHRITQEEVQLTFWPDKPPEKARSTLDTMLSRLRRALQDVLRPNPVKKYLKLQKGVLCLEHVTVDAVDLMAGVARARELVRRHEYWQADTAYAVALDLWKGPFMPGANSSEQVAGYARKLHQTCIDATVEWVDLLNESGQTGRAIKALTHALNFDRGNELLMKNLYRCYMRDGNIARAQQLLQQFEDVFRSEGYSPSEAARMVAALKSGRDE